MSEMSRNFLMGCIRKMSAMAYDDMRVVVGILMDMKWGEIMRIGDTRYTI
jgi:hypothetical protein